MADITFTGNIGKEPKMEYTPNGNAKLSFSVADSKSRPDGNGGFEKLAEQWLRVTVWGDYAAFLADKLKQGSRVRVDGEFMAREYQHNGENRTSLDVTARAVTVIPKRGDNQTRPAQQQPDSYANHLSGSPTDPPF